MEQKSFHDKIAKVCLDHFKSLPKTGKPTEKEWTVMSCIVLETKENVEVVALGTGSKCIGQDKMSDSGDILNDSHAEVLCRRAFLRYLYENMLNSASKITKFDTDTETFHLDPSCKFHFFTTHVPCGDAAIFPKQDTEYFGALVKPHTKKRNIEESPLPNNKKLKLNETSDIFRTGAKCLKHDEKQDPHSQGAQYHILGVVRTKPGRGIPTLSVSCSDKIAKWCHLGLQGALLSQFLNKPIYLTSFTIAGETPFNPHTLKRAFHDRLDTINLPIPYETHFMEVGQSSLKFAYQKEETKNPSPSSIIWLKSSSPKQLEVAVDGRRQGITKKQIKTHSSMLKVCKRELFQYFCRLKTQFDINYDCESYHEAKMNSKIYQEAWNELKSKFGVWTKKDCNLNFSRNKTE